MFTSIVFAVSIADLVLIVVGPLLTLILMRNSRIVHLLTLMTWGFFVIMKVVCDISASLIAGSKYLAAMWQLFGSYPTMAWWLGIFVVAASFFRMMHLEKREPPVQLRSRIDKST